MQLSDEGGRLIALHHLVRHVQEASKLSERGEEEEGHSAATPTACTCNRYEMSTHLFTLTCLKQCCGEGVTWWLMMAFCRATAHLLVCDRERYMYFIPLFSSLHLFVIPSPPTAEGTSSCTHFYSMHNTYT